MTDKCIYQPAVDFIRKKIGSDDYELALAIGSGLDALPNALEDAIGIDYKDIPGFPVSTVEGHAGRLMFGKINGRRVCIAKGRFHYYEGKTDEEMRVLMRVLKLLGAKEVIMTNISGSLNKNWGPGHIALLNDHINFQGRNPLVGKNGDRFGERFFSVDEVYDLDMRKKLQSCAKEQGFDLPEGVYISVLGPCFESPAEIRAFRQWGADLVGMSTVPEVLVAAHCGIKVAVLAMTVNFAVGMVDEKLDHNLALKNADLGAEKMTKLILSYIK